MNLTEATSKVFLAKVFVAAITFAGISYFSKRLGPAAIGSFFLFQASLTILAIPADLTLSKAVQKRMSEENLDREAILTAGTVIKAILAVGVASSVLFLSGPINEYIGANVASLLAAGIFLVQGAQLVQNSIKGELRVSATAHLEVIQSVIWIGSGVLLLRFGGGINGLIIALLIGHAFFLMMGIRLINTRFGTFDIQTVRSLLSYSKQLFISQIASRLYAWADVLILGFILTSSHVGRYNIAWFVSGSLLIFNRALATSIFPQISNWEAKGERSNIEELLPKMVLPSLLFVIPGLFGALIIGKAGLRIFFGEEFVSVWIILLILLIERIFQSLQMVFGTLLQAIGHPDLASRAAVIWLIINVFLNIIFIWHLGILGAAIATLSATIIYSALEIYYASKFFRIRLPLRKIGWIILSSLVMASCLWLVQNIYFPHDILDLIGTIAFGVTIYLFTIALNREVRASTLNRVKSVL